MSYFFPHATREDKRKETIKLFEKHNIAMDEYQKRVGYEALKKIPLCNELLIAKQDNKENKLEFESWRNFTYFCKTSGLVLTVASIYFLITSMLVLVSFNILPLKKRAKKDLGLTKFL